MSYNYFHNCSIKQIVLYAIIFVHSFIVCNVVADNNNNVISVRNQNDFNSLRYTIQEKLKNTDTAEVHFYSGVYYYNDDNNLTFNVNKNSYRGKTIKLIGNSSVLLVSDTTSCTDNVTWENGSLYYVTQNGQQTPRNFERRTQYYEASHLAVLHNNSTNSYFTLNLSGSSVHLPMPDSCYKYIQFTEWFKSDVYPIMNKTSNSVTFRNTAGLSYKTLQTDTFYLPNYDYYQSQRNCYPRFRFISNPKTSNGRRIYYCTQSSYIDAENLSFSFFSITGLNFICNKKTKNCELIKFSENSSDSIVIENCVFNSISGDVICIDKTDKAQIRNNHFQDCYGNCVVSTAGTSETTIKNNTFDRCGKDMFQNFCILCRGTNFMIEGNTINHFSYSAIGVGVDRDNTQNNYYATGTVQNNRIDNQGYDTIESMKQHTLMDAGAIYTWCRLDGVRILNNEIMDYGGVHQYRGIFCDQGTKSVTITGNRISNIKDNLFPNPQQQNYIEIGWRHQEHAINKHHNSFNYVYDNYFDTDTAKFDFQIKYDCHTDTITVTNSNVNSITSLINNAINRGDTLIVVKLPNNSRLTFKDKLFNIRNVNYPIAIKIVGTNTTLVPETLRYSSSDYQRYDSIASKNPWKQHNYGSSYQSIASNWSNWAMATDTIHRTNISRTDHRPTYCLPTGQTSLNVSESNCKGYYIQFTTWYTSQVLPIFKIENGVIHFTSATTDLLSMTNADYTHSNNHTYPRYRYYHVNFNHNYARARTLLNIENCIVSKIELVGVTVDGNNGERALIRLKNVKSGGVNIENCIFKNIHGTVIQADTTQDLTVMKCKFENCLSDGVVSNNGCLRTRVLNSKFANIGGDMTQNFAVICRGRNFLVEGDTIQNFCFGGIGVGMRQAQYSAETDSITGTIRRNKIYFTNEYASNYIYNTLMGGGAIYSWKKNHRITISDNYIHDIRGLVGYKAIVGELGATNLSIINNTIKDLQPDIRGYWSYSIDLPWDSSDPASTNRNLSQSGNIYKYGNRTYTIPSSSGRSIRLIDSILRFEGSAPAVTISLTDRDDSEDEETFVDEASAPRNTIGKTYYFDLNGNVRYKSYNGFTISTEKVANDSQNKTIVR